MTSVVKSRKNKSSKEVKECLTVSTTKNMAENIFLPGKPMIKKNIGQGICH